MTGSGINRVVKLFAGWLRSANAQGPLVCRVPGNTGCISPYLCYPSSYATIKLGGRRLRCFYDPDRDSEEQARPHGSDSRGH